MRGALQADLDRVSRQIHKLVEAIINGADALALNARLKLLETQKAHIEVKFATTPEAEPLLHPGLANIYRKAVAELQTTIRHPETSGEAFGLIRGLIDAVILTPVNGKLEIELRGDLASIFALSKNNKAFSAREKALQIKMVAGTCNFRELTLPPITI